MNMPQIPVCVDYPRGREREGKLRSSLFFEISSQCRRKPGSTWVLRSLCCAFNSPLYLGSVEFFSHLLGQLPHVLQLLFSLKGWGLQGCHPTLPLLWRVPLGSPSSAGLTYLPSGDFLSALPPPSSFALNSRASYHLSF